MWMSRFGYRWDMIQHDVILYFSFLALRATSSPLGAWSVVWTAVLGYCYGYVSSFFFSWRPRLSSSHLVYISGLAITH